MKIKIRKVIGALTVVEQEGKLPHGTARYAVANERGQWLLNCGRYARCVRFAKVAIRGARAALALFFFALTCHGDTTHTISDRGPYPRLVEQGRLIDLSRAAFAQLADTKLGLIQVRIERKQ